MGITISSSGGGSTLVDLTTSVTGVLPIANGGTNSSAALNNSRVMISSGGAIIENAALTASRVMKTTAAGLPTTGQVTLSDTNEITGTLAIANGGTGQTSQTNAFDALAPTTTLGDIIYYNGTDNIRLGIGSSGNVLTVSAGAPVWAAPASSGTVTSVALSLPAIFSVSGSPVTTSGTLTASLATQVANRVWAGPTTGADAAPTFRALVAADIPSVVLTSMVSGVLPVANGGTNSSTALNNGRVMISSGGAIVEASAITVSRALISNGSGIPTHSTVTDTELAYLSGVTSAVLGKDQSGTFTNKTISGASNTLTVRLANDVTGTLPIANGGTGQTSQTAAFDALAPTTTTGDIIYYNGTDNVRLAVGASSQVLTVSGGVPSWATPASSPTSINPTINGRLSTNSSLAIDLSDRASQATLYFVPYLGSATAVYNGSSWEMLTVSSAVSLSLASISSGSNYDVFLYSNSGTPTLELSSAWSSNTVRANSLVQQDGVWVKSGTPTRRYLGTIRGSAAGSIDDTVYKRFLYNYYYRIHRWQLAQDTTDSWNYTTATWRQANANSANKVEFVTGIDEDFFNARVSCDFINTGGANVNVGIGLDSTSSVISGIATGLSANTYSIAYGECSYISGIGYHYLSWNEISDAVGTTTWYGDSGRSFVRSGLQAYTMG